MKHLIKGFLYHVQYSWETPEEAKIKFNTTDNMGDEYWTLIGPYEFMVEVPDNFDIKAHKIATLQEAKRRIQAEFSAKVTEIDRRINELLAIENVS